MQDMGAGSLTQLYLDLDAENRGKEGVVIDIRNNNGGFVNPYAIDVFARRGYLQFTPRDFGTVPGRSVLGQRALEKPTVLVTNMHSLSDAEDFTEGYRALKLGPVVGEPTAGWIIFTSDVGLLDGIVGRARAVRAHHRSAWERHGDASAPGRRARRAADRRELHGTGFAARRRGRRAAEDESSTAVIECTSIAPSHLAFVALRQLALAASARASRKRRQIRRRPFSTTSISFVRCSPATTAYDQVAFMDQYFRWPGNTGFNASIRRVEEILKAAGLRRRVEGAKPGDVADVSHRASADASSRRGSRSTRA